MDLRVSYNWLNEYIKIGKPVEQFARDFSLKSQTVDRLEKVSPKFKGVITAKIIDIKNHPNADRLCLATVTSNQGTQTVVCGAPNIKVGQIVPLAPVGSVVVDSRNEGSSFMITKTKIRDIDSNGMLCSQKELGLGPDHQGIMILPEGTPIGRKLEEILKLEDYILEMEVTSNRPDAMSMIGLAREAAAVMGVKFHLKEPKIKLGKIDEEIDLAVEVRDGKTCPRYQTVVMTGFQVKPSPLWLQLRLITIGFKPINNLVDITNYIAFEYGQPMHVFDYDKISGKKIIVRRAKAGEMIKTLDDQTYKLKSNHLVIADAKKPIAIGGVMGGFDSAATDQTKTLVFECANFDPVAVRKTSRELNLYSDSSSRYEKGLHPENVPLAMARAIELAKDLAGAKVASRITDIYEDKKYKPAVIKFDINELKRYLGVEITPAPVKSILESLGFGVTGSKNLKISVPWWRANDILAGHDLIEEIARIYGYEKFPEKLPEGLVPKPSFDKKLYWERRAKDILAGLGFTEVYNYSFVSKNLLEKTGFSADKALPIFNELNEDTKYMRTSLLPQLLENTSANLNNFSDFQIFELSNTYKSREKDLPEEISTLSGVVVSKDEGPFFQAKGAIKVFLEKMGVIKYRFSVPDFQSLLWDNKKYLDVYQEDNFLGQVGILNKKISAKFGIDRPITLFDFSFEKIAQSASTVKTYVPIPEFPGIIRDISVIVNQTLMFKDLVSVIKHELIQSVSHKDTFEGQTVGEGKKSVLLSIEFRSNERTLQSGEVDEIIKQIGNQLQQKFQAIIR